VGEEKAFTAQWQVTSIKKLVENGPMPTIIVIVIVAKKQHWMLNLLGKSEAEE
jgi:hypothetical protein